MSSFWKLPLVILFLSLFTLACTEEVEQKAKQACELEGAFECLESADGDVDHRICINYEWVESKCESSKQCLGNACVAQADVCEKTGNRCLDTKRIEVCSASELAKIETCGEGLVCDAESCASGEPCCVLTDVCEKTATRCLDAQTVENCTADEAAKIETCGEGLVCDAESCASGEPCCVPTDVCEKTATRCLDAQTVENCTVDEAANVETCGEGLVCDAVACASGEPCCVPTDVCEKTATRCLDAQTVENCTADEAAKIETCGEGLVCDAEACGRGEKCCVASGVCTETANRCLDMDSAELCVEGQMPNGVICGDGLICDAAACASGGECCVMGELCAQTEQICVDENTLKTCVKDQIASEKVCEHGGKCIAGECVVAKCSNHRLDEGEEAIDCGGECAPCIKCRLDSDCVESGFCDSAFDYVCSKRCQTNADCAKSELWDGEYCRGDGRCAPKVFETVWQLEAADPTLVLPFDSSFKNAKCDFQILWGDEVEGTDITTLPHVIDCKNIENRTHVYAEAGRYNVKIIGTYDGWGAFERINESSGSGILTLAASKLRSVVSFGPVGLSKSAFSFAVMLEETSKKDIPDASKLKSLAKTFYKASNFNGSIGRWDVSKVTEMQEMFNGAQVFNSELEHWNTSQVTDMSWLFVNAKLFNRAIGQWDTSKVTNMSRMFLAASAFDQPIGTWDTSSVTDMSVMFSEASSFNQAIDAWDTSKVIHMDWMFSEASSFNQPLGAWHTSQVKEMEFMFYEAPVFDQPIGAWDTSSVTNMKAMFAYASHFNQPLGDWNLSQVTDISGMFSHAKLFNQPIGVWDTSEVEEMDEVFSSASMFNQNIQAWDLSNVTKMSGMFQEAVVFNQPLGSWNVSGVNEMYRVFKGASAFDQSLVGWRLNAGVALNFIFESSGISAKNLCALKAKGGAWLAQWANLGKDASCK